MAHALGIVKNITWSGDLESVYSKEALSRQNTQTFDLRTPLPLLHFIQVISPFIIYSHLSFRHVELCSIEGHGFDSRWETHKFFFLVFRLDNSSPLLKKKCLL